MASRAIGAILAVVAAITFVISLASPRVTAAIPAWWDGHPSALGKTFERMDAHVGVLGAERCFDGAANCSMLDTNSAWQAIGYAEAGATGLAALLALVLAISIATLGDRRKGIAKVVLAVVLVAGALSAVLVVIGPGIEANGDGRTLEIDVPLGIGLFMFWGATGAGLIASVVGMRVEREPLRLKPSLMPQIDPALANTVDVREALREQHGGLGPAALGPEPMMGGSVAVPVTPMRGSAPLVPQAPQLRPLYDVQGAAPVPAAPVLPVAPPTPVPRASMRAIAGIDTPAPAVQTPRGRMEHVPAPPSHEDRPDSQPIEPPPPPLRVPTLADVTARKPPTMPPPQPPPRPSPVPRGSQPAMQPPQRPSQRPSQPPPLGRKTPMAGEKPIGRKTPVAGEKPIHDKAVPERVPEKRTIAHAVPPMPRAETDVEDVEERRPTSVREVENVTAVEIDAEAKAAAVAQQQQQQALAKQLALAKQHAAETAQMVEGSDTGVSPAPTAPDRTDQMEIEAALQRPPTATDSTPIAPPAPAALADVVKLPISTAPTSLPPPKKVETAISGPTPACPQCEAPMAWVEEHLRFYCKQCKMYF